MLQSMYPNSDRPGARASLDFVSLAGAVIIIINFITHFNFNSWTMDNAQIDRPVQVAPATGTRSPTTLQGPPL